MGHPAVPFPSYKPQSVIRHAQSWILLREALRFFPSRAVFIKEGATAEGQVQTLWRSVLAEEWGCWDSTDHRLFPLISPKPQAHQPLHPNDVKRESECKNVSQGEDDCIFPSWQVTFPIWERLSSREDHDELVRSDFFVCSSCGQYRHTPYSLAGVPWCFSQELRTLVDF